MPDRSRREFPMIAGKDWARYAEHAAWQSIEVHLNAARRTRDKWDRYVKRIEDLLTRRRQEVADGTWPQAPKEPTHV